MPGNDRMGVVPFCFSKKTTCPEKYMAFFLINTNNLNNYLINEH